jgi:hypothetical protein
MPHSASVLALPVEDWPQIVDTMAERAKLKRAERDAIVAYILTVRDR